jgi:hypothetical protein
VENNEFIVDGKIIEDHTTRNIIIVVVLFLLLMCCCCACLSGVLIATSGWLEEIAAELGVLRLAPVITLPDFPHLSPSI